jgi:hypothetical protein
MDHILSVVENYCDGRFVLELIGKQRIVDVRHYVANAPRAVYLYHRR